MSVSEKGGALGQWLLTDESKHGIRAFLSTGVCSLMFDEAQAFLGGKSEVY
jgi:hypothetical protein